MGDGAGTNFADKISGGLFANPDSGPGPQTAGAAMNEQLQAYINNMPALYSAQTQGALQNQPLINEMAYQQMQKYAAPTAALQQQIAAQNAQSGAASNLALLQGTGGDVARSALALSRETNPNYYALNDAATAGAKNLLSSINLNGLSGGERAAVERSLNQSNYATGNLGLDNATTAVQNAMQYGDRMAGKRAEYGNALGVMNNTLATGQQYNPVNPVGLALGTSQTNTGNTTSFGTPQAGIGTQDPLSGIPQMIAGAGNQQNQAWADFNKWDSQRGKLDSWAGNMGGICCFIFLESYNGKLPWYVRRERDYYYRKEPALGIGYKRMASWLVPLMRRWLVVRYLVNYLMVKPITAVGAYDRCLNNYGRYLRPVKSLWFSIWRNYGTR